MRPVDEITERPIARALPAPSGLPIPTGPVPATSFARTIPPPAAAAPILPTLPPAAPRPAGPVTSQVAVTNAAAQLFHTTNVAPVPGLPPKRRRRKVLIVVAIVCATAMMAAILFRNSALIERFTGHGYDTNPLPTHALPQPPFTGAEYTLTSQSIAMTNSLPTNYWRTDRNEVNYAAKIAKVTIDQASASVIGGTIGTPQSTSSPTAAVVDEQSTYLSGATQTDPWIRQPHDPGSSVLALLSSHGLLMYQDVIDPTLRSQQPTSVVHETRHDVPVTTYSYTFSFGKFYESAPRLFDMLKLMDGNAATDAVVAVTISLDEQWMVRYLDVNVDFQAVLEYKAARDVDTTYPYRYTFDVVSITDAPADIAAPTNTVDPTTTTATTAPPTVVP